MGVGGVGTRWKDGRGHATEHAEHSAVGPPADVAWRHVLTIVVPSIDQSSDRKRLAMREVLRKASPCRQ
jgi:hypothetical protein